MNKQTSKFAYAMNGCTTTSNGAVSLSSPDPSGESSGRVGLFFKGVRGLDTPTLYKFLNESAKENIIDTFILVFNMRDCRGGKGERDLGRQSIIWLFINYPDMFKKVMNIIPDYGRWDDLVCLFPGVLDIDFVSQNYSLNVNKTELEKLNKIQTDIVNMYCKQLVNDYKNMLEGNQCSLSAKWVPSEGSSVDRSSGVFKLMASLMKISPKNLRKKYISPLRSYITIVEKCMCEGKWGDINYNKVPSCAMKRLKNAFGKHDKERFNEWKVNLRKHDTKVNAKQLFPYELIKEIRVNKQSDEVCEAQWEVLEEECKKNGSLNDDIAVVDTSASMTVNNCIPLDVAISMGLLISSCSVGKFKNCVLTFNSVPAFATIKDGSLFDRWNQIKSIPWGGSTDIQATFKLILDRGVSCNLKQEDMPKRLWIISDMQFNDVEGNESSTTNYEAIDKMYSDYGYKRPRIVFWNVNGYSTDFPVSVLDDDTCLISGFSPSIMKAVLDGDDSFSPYGIMRKAIDDTLYTRIRDALETE